MARGSAIVLLEIGSLETRASLPGDPSAPVHRLAVGAQQVGRGPLRHEPPTPLELEQAIAVIEDEVMPLAKSLPRDAALEAVGDHVARLVRLAGDMGAPGATGATGATGAAGTVASLDAIEAIFQRLAEVSQGRPVASGGVPVDGAFAATLLIVREFMHHLGYSSVTLREPSEPGGARSDRAAD